ncbi:MAG: 2-oxo acid dehydrogenase subunit E2 [Fimbriimonadaceae bacterium]|jgi:pyruvate dehydrogenase E2 component (dihydrolipoamide acetyltransferase)|nr:2-oxo acid dehydrogenase subunit E2 [Fimbriimonadaceae bacterium]
MTEVIMPKMGDGMEEGTLLEWLKKEGDLVKSGEVIGTIQTDKATLELTAPGKGKLAGILIGPNDTVPVGQPIAALLKDGESLPASWGGGSGSTPAPSASSEPAPSAAVTAAVAPDVRVKASPLARKIAEEAGLNLGLVVGSGPQGRIVEKDVRDAIASGVGKATPVAAPVAATPTAAPAAAPAPAALTIPTVAVTAEDSKVKLNRLRQITAERTTASKQQVPHFYVTVEVDLEKIDALRNLFKDEQGGKVSVNDFIIRASALALRELPVVNSTYQGDHLLQYGAVNIGMAVALEDGLTVPVIANADHLTLRQISEASRILAAKARDNKLAPNELSGSTFAISNMGMLEVENFGAIINTPNAAIVAVGTARKKVIVGENDELEIRLRMNLTGSFDHRVVDGAVGARFMNILKTYLENPTRLLS